MTAETPAPDVAKVARAWWRQLQRTLPDGTRNPRGDPGALARLRRCAGPADAMAEPAVLDLFRRLGGRRPDALPRVAVVALVLAHVRVEVGADRHKCAAQAVGCTKPDDAESARMSRLRFRRLLACRDDDDLAREMRRFVVLADRTVNVGDLAASLFFWGDSVRARWAFHYYGAGFAAPASEEHPS